jgi:hypothetical protein
MLLIICCNYLASIGKVKRIAIFYMTMFSFLVNEENKKKPENPARAGESD